MEALLANPPQANGLPSPALLATPPSNPMLSEADSLFIAYLYADRVPRELPDGIAD